MKDMKTVLLKTLCVISILFCLYLLNSITELKNTNKSLSTFSNTVQMKENFLNSNFHLNSEMTGMIAPDIFIEGEKNEGTFLLSKSLKEKPLLIYRFTGANCKDCYIDLLTELQKEIKEVNCDNIKVLCSRINKRDVMILKMNHNITLPIFLISSTSFDWSVEEKNKPYYFVLHPNMKISHIYVPDKKYPELNRQYLIGIMRILSD